MKKIFILLCLFILSILPTLGFSQKKLDQFLHTMVFQRQYGQGLDSTIIVIDSGQHGEDVKTIIKTYAPLSNVVYFNQPNLQKRGRIMELVPQLKDLGLDVDIVNNSNVYECNSWLYNTVKSIIDKDIIFVTGSGNDSTKEFCPAKYELNNLVSVGGYDVEGCEVAGYTAMPYSILAPVCFDVNNHISCGTSFATPLVSAFIACAGDIEKVKSYLKGRESVCKGKK